MRKKTKMKLKLNTNKMTTYNVTKDKLFYDKVVDLDLDGLIFQQDCFKGTMGIETEEGWIYIAGMHGVHDYSEEYGFKLIKEHEN